MAVRDTCSACHAAPKDTGDRGLKVECSKCHGSKAWKPAHFDHALLAKAELDRCQSCHNVPTDRLHRHFQGGCRSCHKTKAWKPATFDHNKYFVLDCDHEATCETCHKKKDYSRYACYGCHEHSQAKVRAEHPEEGIPDFENCVEGHRDPGVEPEKLWGREQSGRERD